MYHWDGPGAIPHHEALLSVSGIDAIQWTPGSGVEPLAHARWWPLYHRTVEAGKKVVLLGVGGLAELAALKREFGPELKQFLLSMHVRSAAEAEEILEQLRFN